MSAQGLVGATLGALLLTCPASPAEHAPDAYVLSQGNDTWCTGASVDDIMAVRSRAKGRFLWARRAGKEYLILDPDTVDQAQSLFSPLQLDEPERENLARKQERLDAEENALERQQEAIEEDLEAASDEAEDSDRGRTADRDAERRRLEKRQEEIESKLATLGEREAELEAEEQAADARDEAREAQVEAELWRLIDRSIASGVAHPVESPAR